MILLFVLIEGLSILYKCQFIFNRRKWKKIHTLNLKYEIKTNTNSWLWNISMVLIYFYKNSK
jgi:hypothetical protein